MEDDNLSISKINRKYYHHFNVVHVPDDIEAMLGAGLEEVLVVEEETVPCPCVADVVTGAAGADNALGGGALCADELGWAPGGRELGAGAPGGRELGAGTPGAWELGEGPPGAGVPAGAAVKLNEGELWLVSEALELGTRPKNNETLVV